jgi:hypothetical protein
MYLCGKDVCDKIPVQCPQVDCPRPRIGCKTDWSRSKELDTEGCAKYPCG